MVRIANISGNRKFNAAIIVALLVAGSSIAHADTNSAQAIVRHRATPVVTYTASLQGGYLVVEAEHAPDWHTYAMDNVQRARDKTGKEKPDCELPTRFDVEGPIELTGAWRQSHPADLSDPSIHWYTWGFEDRAVFAAPATVTGEGPITITINAQACNASSCSMVQDVKLTLDTSQRGENEIDYDALVQLQAESQD